MKEVGTLTEIGAQAGDTVQFEDKAPYESPLTQHEINTEHRTGFRLVKRKAESRPINDILETIREGTFYEDFDQSSADLRTLREALAKPQQITVDVAGAMDKFTPEMIEAMAPLLLNPLIMTLEQQVTALQEALNRVRAAMGMESGIAAAPGDIAAEVEKRFPGDQPGDFWITYDNQTGQWLVQQETFKVVRSFDDPIYHVRLVERFHAEHKRGWQACLHNLMNGGSRLGADFHSVDGRVLGRFNGFIPAGATHDDRAQFFDALAKMEIAAKDAVPLDFGDLRWKGAAE